VSVFDDGRRDRTPRPPLEPDHNAAARLRAAENRLLTIAGEDGNNGKLGVLRRDLTTLERWLAWVAGGVLTALLGSAGAVYWVGHKDGDEARTIETQRADIAALKAQAAEAASMLASLRIEFATLRAMTLAPRRTGGK
jgi:hypothetical protein